MSKPFLAALLVLSGLAAMPLAPADAGDGPLLLNGRFSILWGDAEPGTLTASQRERFWLIPDAGGSPVELDLAPGAADAAGGLLAVDRQQVTVQGGWLGVPGRRLFATRVTLAGPGSPLSVQVSEPWVSVLCKFAGAVAEPQPPSYFDGLMGSAEPGLNHYWREVSYNAVDITGSVTRGWYTLPHPRSYYITGNPPQVNFETITHDCVAVADAQTFFPTYSGINLMFNDNLDGYAWGGSYVVTVDGQTLTYYVTWEPPWGYAKQSVIAHEMGHGFGFPHSSGNYGLVYDNWWDVESVSSGYWNCVPGHPIYTCIGQHTIAYHKDRVGWLPAGQRYTYPGSGLATITLEQLALPQTGNYLIARIPYGTGSTRFYTVEARRKVSYDTHLPDSAVIIHDVYTIRNEPAHVVDIDLNGHTGDEGAIWRVGETFSDPINNVYVSVVGQTATGWVITIGPPGVPVVTGLDPNIAIAGSGDQVVAVLGSGFAPGSIVRWNGASRATTFVSTAQLSATILASDLTAPGGATVTVYTPAPGGGISNPLSFTIVPPVGRVFLPSVWWGLCGCP